MNLKSAWQKQKNSDILPEKKRSYEWKRLYGNPQEIHGAMHVDISG